MVEFLAIATMLIIGQLFSRRLSRRAAEVSEQGGRALLQVRQPLTRSPQVIVFPFALMFMGFTRLMEVQATPDGSIRTWVKLAVSVALVFAGARYVWAVWRTRQIVTSSLTERGVVFCGLDQEGYLFWPWKQIKRWSWRQSRTLQLNLFDGRSVQTLSIDPAIREDVERILRQNIFEVTGGAA